MEEAFINKIWNNCDVLPFMPKATNFLNISSLRHTKYAWLAIVLMIALKYRRHFEIAPEEV